MKYPWTICGLSMDNVWLMQWVICGLLMEDPWDIRGLAMDYPGSLLRTCGPERPLSMADPCHGANGPAKVRPNGAKKLGGGCRGASRNVEGCWGFLI